MGKNTRSAINPSTFPQLSLIYSQNTLNKVKEIILSLPKRNRPIVISITGGSGVGKSTLSSYIQNVLYGRVTVLEMDNFQLGDDFEHKDRSPYRWDDPRNFDLFNYEIALKSLKSNKIAEIPLFSLKENRRIGKHFLKPNDFIIAEGLYTLSNQLMPLIDFSIYLETSFYARFLRRIFRFTEESKINLPEVPVKHMLLPTHKAHQDFVRLQKHKANMVISVPYSFEETKDKFQLEKKGLTMPKGNIVYAYKNEDDISILGLIGEDRQQWLLTTFQDKVIYKARITNDLLEALTSVNFGEN